MALEKLAVAAAIIGSATIMASVIATIAASLTEQDLTYFTSIMNSLGLGMMSFGAGGILYVVTHGS
jgi:hypothetical protein